MGYGGYIYIYKSYVRIISHEIRISVMNQPVFVGNVKYVFLFMLLSWGGVVIAILRDLCLFSW